MPVAGILETFFETVKEGLLVLDSSDEVVLANSALGSFVGTETRELIGKQFFETSSVLASLPSVREALDSLRRRGGTFEKFEVTLPGKPEKIAMVNGRVLRRDEKSEYVLLAIEDVTEHRMTQRALARETKELERSNHDLEQFAAAASHDLQEPLRKIQAFGVLLAQKHGSSLDEQGREYIRIMTSAAARLQTLVADQLAYARIAVKAPVLERVSLQEIAETVVADLEPAIQKSGASVTIGTLPEIEADAGLMAHMFQNLIGNGLKFARADVPPVISVYANDQKGELKAVTITVEDNGIGIPAQYLDRIFRPFQKLHNRTEYEGSGMGLSIVRRVVDRHHGGITVESEPGSGSRFHITLPNRFVGENSNE